MMNIWVVTSCLAIKNKACMNICVQILVWALFFLGYSKEWNTGVECMLSFFKKTARSFPILIVHSYSSSNSI